MITSSLVDRPPSPCGTPLQAAVQAGLTEPASLHPSIDPARCLGSASCIVACPEGALGIINGKAQLINPTVCIGHGACKAACPHDAITLVFGTEKRGVDIRPARHAPQARRARRGAT